MRPERNGCAWLLIGFWGPSATIDVRWLVFWGDLINANPFITFLGTNYADASNYQNPASPEVLATPPPWDIPRSDTATPTAAMHLPSDLSGVPQSHDANPVVPTYGPTPSAHAQPTSDSPAAETEATGTHVSEQQDIVDSEILSAVNALSSQADVSATELAGLNDNTEHTDDMPEDRPGIPERDRWLLNLLYSKRWQMF
jgi:hypothetical protein